jgi:hypothetical protein
MTNTENNVAAQAGDETALLAKQLRKWRAEVARLNDLIAHASGVQASDEPMLPQPACTYADHSYPAFKKRQMIEYGEQRYQAGLAAVQVSPRATADVERDAVLEEVALHFDAKVRMCNPAYVAEFVRDLKSAATKGAKP